MNEDTGTKVQWGSGNVFEDLGFGGGEARNLRLRSELMRVLSDCLEREGWTQAEAAKRLKVSQPRISDLKRGKLDRFSLDMLVKLLDAAGIDVEVRVKRGTRRAA
jgi:predicted XRE-type DNA-binding protein